MEGFESRFQYIEIQKNMNIKVFPCFGKVNPALAVPRSIRMVFWSLPEPLKPFKTIQKIEKLILMNIHVFFMIFSISDFIGPVFGPVHTKY